jgi:hypothetical protein
MAGTITNDSSVSIGITLSADETLGNTSTGTVVANGYAVYGAVGSTDTVINAGLLNGKPSVGIRLNGGGAVQNSAVGVIEGENAGVQIMGAAGYVTNLGTIQSNGLGGQGLILGAGGTLTNAGMIAGSRDAVHLYAGFTNQLVVDPGARFFGTVDGGNTIGATSVSTLELASAASSGTLTKLGSQYINFAQITIDSGADWAFLGNNTLVAGATLTNSGTLANSGMLVDKGVLTGGGTLNNTGSISVASADGLSLAGGAVTNALDAEITGAFDGLDMSGGSVVNAGTITSSGAQYDGVKLNGGSVTNQTSGLIQGVYNAAVLENGATLSNAGSVSGTGADADGAGLFGGGEIANLLHGVISGANLGVGVYLTPGTVTNAGVISGGSGVVIYAGGVVTNSSGGTITGTAYGVQIEGGSGTVVNSGRIATTGSTNDALQLAYGSTDRLVIYPGAEFIGTVSGGNTYGATSISTLELTSAATTGTLTGLGSQYIDFAQITIDSGADWALSGSNTIAVGATMTDGGTLNNNGGITVAGAYGLSVRGGVVTNAQTASITGTFDGLDVSGGSVVNAGTITGSGSRYSGVNLSGGSATNQTGGLIQGGYYGVFLNNGATLSNAGSVSGTGAVADGAAIFGGGEVANLLHGVISGANLGVGAYRAPATVTNAGVISGGSGVVVTAGGAVTNSSGGTITGTAYGVQIEGGSGTVVNAGKIATTGATSDALQLAVGSTNRLVIYPGAEFIGKVSGGNTVGATSISTLELASAATTGTLTGLGSQYIDFAQITIDSNADWAFSGSNTIAAGATMTSSGTIANSGTLVNNGLILLDSGTLTVGRLAGTGAVTIGSGGSLTVVDQISNDQTFSSSSGQLELRDPRADSGTIAGFVAGDTIDLQNVINVTNTNLVNGDTLQITQTGLSPIDLLVSGDFTGEFFHHTESDGSTFITVNDTPCFCRGTLIRTDRGDVPVEALKLGDLVMTLSGVPRPIRWIGVRHLDLTRHPKPHRVCPIRIRAGAFADGVPCRDLFVSPDHAVLRDGVLVPARLLLNGASIQRDTARRSVDYYHVELAAHDILLAENLPTESYLDTGNRGMFENTRGPLVLHPDLTNDQARRVAESCMPFADDAARVEPIWRDLAIRAVQLGLPMPVAPETTDDPGLCLLVDQRGIAPIGVTRGRYVFILPRNDRAVRLSSRAAAPGDTAPWIADERRLGVMLGGLTVHAGGQISPIPLDHPALGDGWWEPEWHNAALRRWTNGDALLPVPLLARIGDGPCLLEVEIAAAGPYSSGESRDRAPLLRRLVKAAA